MNIERLIERQEAVIADMTKSLKARGFDAAVLARPTDIQQKRAASIESRIAALENEKREHARAIDDEIGGLKSELKTLSQSIKKDQELLAPAVKGKTAAVSRKPKATTRAKKG